MSQLEHAFILCKSKLIDLQSLPSEIVPEGVRNRPETVGQLSPLETAEAEAILRCLAQNGGHREKTARALGIHKTTLIRKMKKLQITFTPV